MSLQDTVRIAKSPRDAILALAKAVDAQAQLLHHLNERVRKLEDTEGDWDSWNDEAEPTIDSIHGAVTAEPPASPTYEDVMLREVSPEKQARRRMFADQQLRLNEALKGVDDTEDWVEHYVSYGPLWLYANRELVMTYPDEVRAQMVADVDEESSELAHEMSRDILKAPCEVPDIASGQGAIGIGEINGKGGHAVSGNAGGIKS